MTTYLPAYLSEIIPSRSRCRVIACGLYAIVNTRNGRLYIGSSVDVAGRLAHHVASLRRGRHPNAKLQAAWRKYGAEGFAYHLITMIPQDDLAQVEQSLIDRLLPSGILYNLSRFTGAPFRGRRHTAEWKAAHSARMRGTHYNRGRKQPPDEIARRSAAVADALRGKRLSDEHRAALRRGWEKRRTWWQASEATRAKLSAAGRGRKLSADICAKIGARKRGQRLTPEHRTKLREAWVRRKARTAT